MRFRVNITTENMSTFKIARARLDEHVAMKCCLLRIWFVESIVNINQILFKHLKSDVKQICNSLAERFAFNSSSVNYSHKLNRYKLTVE